MAVTPSRAAFTVNGEGEAGIEDPNFSTALIQNPGGALGLIAQVAPSVKLSELSVDAHGRVVIDNAEFQAYVKGMVANPVGAVGNGTCGLAC